MKATLTAAAVALSLAGIAMPASANCSCKPQAMPTVLEAVVVTPNGSYTLTEWEQRQAAKEQLAATPTVYFQPVIVTPDFDVKAERRDYARARTTGAGGSGHAQASMQTVSPWHPSRVLEFLRRLSF